MSGPLELLPRVAPGTEFWPVLALFPAPLPHLICGRSLCPQADVPAIIQVHTYTYKLGLIIVLDVVWFGLGPSLLIATEFILSLRFRG